MSGFPRRLPTTSLTFRLRMSRLVGELESVVRSDPADRARAVELAGQLEGACKAQGLRQLVVMARCLGSLMRLPAEQIRSIEPLYAEKVRELLGMIKSAATRVLSGAG